MIPLRTTKVYAEGAPSGVPADRLSGARRLGSFDHRGRVTALVAGETDVLSAIAVHHTGTTDVAWDGGANEKNLDNDDGEEEYRKMYAWVDPDADPDTKAAYAFPHHMVGSDGKVGDANVKACSSGIGVLNGGRGGSSSAAWWDDRKGIFAHLVAHLKDSGVKDEDLPELEDMSLEEYDALVARMEEVGAPRTPSEALAAMRESAERDPERERKFVEKSTPVEPADLAEKIKALRARQAATPEVERTPVKVVTASGEVELEMAVRWDEDAVDPYRWDSERGAFGARGAFVSTLPEADPFAVVAAGDGVPQIVDDPGAPWHAILCVEGLRTDEDPSRELMPGSCQFPDLPVSLRLQIHDEGGHWGAVTCGRIDSMERQELDGYNAIYAEGIFGTDEHGQTGQLLVEEQTQRFISIDPRDVEVEIIEIEVSSSSSGIYDYDCDDDEPELYDWWLRYTSLTIGAATIVATPALQQAVITLASVELPETPIAVENARTSVIVADGGPLEPPAAWFESPGFHVGDPRLVRQRDGKYACPLTVTDDGRVFGHVCYWGQRHTGFLDRIVTPPRSKADLAHFLTGPGVRCAEGSTIYGVGQITMGVGHAAINLGHAAAKAHYDGGYGAVQVADVRAGQDDFGVWVAGAMRSDLTAEQVRAFRATNLSGDWRGIGGNAELVAVLAGVTVPGFPISRQEALVASAELIDSIATRVAVDPDGAVLALVAAGRVERISVADQLAGLQRAVDVLLSDRAARILEADQAALAEMVSV